MPTAAVVFHGISEELLAERNRLVRVENREKLWRIQPSPHGVMEAVGEISEAGDCGLPLTPGPSPRLTVEVIAIIVRGERGARNRTSTLPRCAVSSLPSPREDR